MEKRWSGLRLRGLNGGKCRPDTSANTLPIAIREVAATDRMEGKYHIPRTKQCPRLPDRSFRQVSCRMVEILRYRREDGRDPFTEWLDAVRDKMAQARIRIRLRQVQAGNFGDIEPVGDGVSELRIHIGAGYRVYCGRHGKAVVILLCGGDKGRQAADIKRARVLWSEWKRRSS